MSVSVRLQRKLPYMGVFDDADHEYVGALTESSISHSISMEKLSILPFFHPIMVKFGVRLVLIVFVQFSFVSQ